MSAFNIGDTINFGGETGELIAFRHAVGNHRTGETMPGYDVLFASGKVRHRFLHDIAMYNPDRLAALRLAAAAPDLLAALKLADKLNAALTDAGLLDELAGHMHPDEINAACDAVTAAIAKAEGRTNG